MHSPDSLPATAPCRRSRRLAAIAALLLALPVISACWKDSTTSSGLSVSASDPVIARVNGVDIKQSDLALAEEDVGTDMPADSPDAKREQLIAAYEKIGRTADDLPYTPHFESMYSGYAAQHAEPRPTRSEVWRHLLNLRKAGKLPKMGEARSKPPVVSDEDRAALRKMLGDDIGKRDRLPYTERFDAIVDSFNRTQPRPLSPHLVWRLVATLAK